MRSSSVVVLIACCLFAAALFGQENSALEQRLKRIRATFLAKQSAGADVSRAAKIAQQLQQARESKDRERFVRLLTQLEQALQEAVVPAASEPIQGGAFHLGLEYARPGKARNLRSLGTGWIRIGPVMWERCEPAPPRAGKHSYQWTRLDALVREYQSAGFQNIQLVTSARCGWASEATSSVSPESALPPTGEHWADYGKFIGRLVERYDGDQRDDMPGLRFPVRFVAIESEAQHAGYWAGTFEEYLRLAKTARDAAKAAHPETKLISSGLNAADFFDGDPGAAEIQMRRERLGVQNRATQAFMEALLKHGEVFDVIDFHFAYDYRGGYGVVNWIRQRMKSHGYQRPIWAGDAAAAPMIDRLFTRDRSREESDELFEALRSPRHEDHANAVRWFERKQAESLVKKVLVCMDAEVAGINFGNLVDWPDYWGGRNWTFQGLCRQDGSRRPAFYAYQLLTSKIRTVQSVERLPTQDDVFVYRLQGEGKALFVAWAEGQDQSCRLPVRTPLVLVTSVPVESSRVPAAQRREAEGDAVTLTLSSTPIIIEPAAH